MATVRINPAALQALTTGPQARAYLTRLGREIVIDARLILDIRTSGSGKLANSIEVEHTQTGIRVGSNLDYALAVHEGLGNGRRRPVKFLTEALRRNIG